jgi:iron complex transport system substrate-binding protein
MTIRGGAEERLFAVTDRLSRVALFASLLAILAFTSSSTLAQESAPVTPEAVAPQLPVTVTDVDGNQVTVTDVSRIVPLSGDVAEIVWTLGLGANIVGADLSAVYPAELTQLPQIGFERQLSAEGILSLNPTLVIGKEQAGPPAVLDQVRAAGVPVVIVAEPQTIEAPTAKIRSVAAALGVTEVGEALAAKTQAEIDDAIALAATATSKPTVMFLYVRSGGVQLIGGSGSVADAMIEAAGGVDAGVAAGIQGFMPVTAEAIVAAQPDYIIVPQSGLDSIGGMDALLQIPGLAETPAAKNGNVLAVDDLLLLSMTPRTGQALHALILAIHPELAAATPEASPVA